MSDVTAGCGRGKLPVFCDVSRLVWNSTLFSSSVIEEELVMGLAKATDRENSLDKKNKMIRPAITLVTGRYPRGVRKEYIYGSFR